MSNCVIVFLSGCQQLVVLCGKTYTQRVWCVIELFTWLSLIISMFRMPLGGH